MSFLKSSSNSRKDMWQVQSMMKNPKSSVCESHPSLWTRSICFIRATARFFAPEASQQKTETSKLVRWAAPPKPLLISSDLHHPKWWIPLLSWELYITVLSLHGKNHGHPWHSCRDPEWSLPPWAENIGGNDDINHLCHGKRVTQEQTTGWTCPLLWQSRVFHDTVRQYHNV